MFSFLNLFRRDDDLLRRLALINMEIHNMSDELNALNANLDKLNATVSGVVGVLTELKTKLDEAIAAGSLDGLRAASERLASITDNLRAAAVAVDPTPETPVV